MIELIKIKNYALIQDSEIDLSKGLNIITGETGAGKSLFIGALSLILGDKISKNLIGKNAEETTVEVIIKSAKIVKRAKELDLDVEIPKDSSVIIKRVFGEKNRSYINGELITQSQLKKLMAGTVEICSQHENQSILEKANQLNMLDIYCEIDTSILKEKFISFKTLSDQKAKLLKEKTQQEAKKDFLEFQLEEIKKLNPTKEDLEIEAKLAEIKSQTQISDIEKNIYEFFNGDDGVKTKLNHILFALRSLDRITNEEKAISFKKAMDDILSYNVSRSSLDSEDQLQYYIERMETLNKIKRKHGGSIESLLDARSSLEEELDNIENFDENIQKIEADIKKAESAFLKEAKVISKIRKEKSSKLAKEIESGLKDLNISNAKFEICIEEKSYSDTGIDSVEYLISANKGEDLQPISEIASGGELSRVLLSIYKVLGGKNTVYLFDEVDAGIGGDTGTKIGKKLQEMAKNSQIICITHLPQVAIFAQSNFKIDKKENSQKTVSNISKLNMTETEIEISRMLGSSVNESSALSHAKELIKKARS